MSLELITPPALEPVTLSEMKLQCGFGPMEDTDQLREATLAEELRDAITSARQDCENITGRAFITQTWALKLDVFPHPGAEYLVHDRLDIELPIPKFAALSSFIYLDTTGAPQDMLAADSWGFQIAGGGDTQPARLRPPALRGWPITQWDTANAVTITYTCGYGDTPAAVPRAIRNAIKVQAKWLYEGAIGPKPTAIASLLSDYMNLIA